MWRRSSAAIAPNVVADKTFIISPKGENPENDAKEYEFMEEKLIAFTSTPLPNYMKISFLITCFFSQFHSFQVDGSLLLVKSRILTRLIKKTFDAMRSELDRPVRGKRKRLAGGQGRTNWVTFKRMKCGRRKSAAPWKRCSARPATAFWPSDGAASAAGDAGGYAGTDCSQETHSTATRSTSGFTPPSVGAERVPWKRTTSPGTSRKAVAWKRDSATSSTGDLHSQKRLVFGSTFGQNPSKLIHKFSIEIKMTLPSALVY